MLKIKIVHLKKIYKFDLDHLFVKRTVFVLIQKTLFINKKLGFPAKQCEICKNVK